MDSQTAVRRIPCLGLLLLVFFTSAHAQEAAIPPQVHQVKFPGGARTQLTFFSDPIDAVRPGVSAEVSRLL
jgi:hypothetical protein